MEFLKKPYRWAIIITIIIIAFSTFVLLDTFVIPKSKETVENYNSDSNTTINESDTTKEIIKAFLKANNNSLEDEDITMIYDSVIRTRDNEKKDNSKTSEYFQYKGIETNLKETINGDKSIYQFRIGRITE